MHINCAPVLSADQARAQLNRECRHHSGPRNLEIALDSGATARITHLILIETHFNQNPATPNDKKSYLDKAVLVLQAMKKQGTLEGRITRQAIRNLQTCSKQVNDGDDRTKILEQFIVEFE